MEYCDLGSLRHILDQKKKGFEEPFIAVFVSQVVHALDYLHNVKNIIHRDIKCGNILVTSSGTSDQKIKIADYGTSTGTQISTFREFISLIARGKSTFKPQYCSWVIMLGSS